MNETGLTPEELERLTDSCGDFMNTALQPHLRLMELEALMAHYPKLLKAARRGMEDRRQGKIACELFDTLRSLQQYTAAVNAENARLRAALEEACPNCEHHPSGHCLTCVTRRPCRGDIIREALNPEAE